MPAGLFWPIWRLVVKRIATLHEIETHWCLSDLVLANEALDVNEELERRAEAIRAERMRG